MGPTPARRGHLRTPEPIRHRPIAFPVPKTNRTHPPWVKERGLLVHSWGRINIESFNNKELYKFNDDDEASEILINIIKEKYLKGRVEIFWSNAETCPIECGIDFLEKFAKEIIYEDWDLWIFCKKEWIIEKYHEGEIVFYKI